MATKEAPIVHIAQDCLLQGDFITQRDAVVGGQFTGVFQAKGRLKVESGGSLSGRVEAGALSLLQGGILSASVIIGTDKTPVVQAKQERTPPPPKTPKSKNNFVRGLEELAKFALGRK